ncbi:hypothetical protein [Micromonospora globbae]|uniref:hypothetical protein n=1 Tax=Micromonospora globbae TaxID=1894969 RepID=UPI0037A2CF0C
MARSITAHVHFRPDRSMQVVVPGPDGPIDAGMTRRSKDIGRMAREAASAAYGGEPVELAILVDRPPWLWEGALVRPDPAVVDPGEAPTHPYGQVVAFLPVGGVVVMHPESGSGVYAPEDLVVCDPESIDPGVREAVVRCTGITASEG